MLDATNRNFLPPSSWTPERREQLRWLWEHEGKSAMQIAVELGGFEHCQDGGRNAVIGIVHRMGLTRNGSHRPGVSSDTVVQSVRAAIRQRQARANEDRSATQRLAHKSKSPQPPQRRKEPPAPAEFLGLTFMEVADTNLCRFPRGEGKDMKFCGQPQMKGESYCSRCCAVAFNFVPITTRKNPPPAHYATGPGSGLRAFGA